MRETDHLGQWQAVGGQQGGPSLFHLDIKKLHFVLTSSVPYALRKPFSLQRKEKKMQTLKSVVDLFILINVVIALNLPFCFKLLEH